MFSEELLMMFIVHRVPKLATTPASNTCNSVWSSWISTKYCILHYLKGLL